MSGGLIAVNMEGPHIGRNGHHCPKPTSCAGMPNPLSIADCLTDVVSDVAISSPRSHGPANSRSGLTSSSLPGDRSTSPVRFSKLKALYASICSKLRYGTPFLKLLACNLARRTPATSEFDSALDFREKSDPHASAEAWMRTEMREAIPLDDPALFRFALIRVDDNLTFWLQKYHHIIIDATGRRLFSARTAARYRALRFGEPLALLDAATPRRSGGSGAPLCRFRRLCD